MIQAILHFRDRRGPSHPHLELLEARLLCAVETGSNQSDSNLGSDLSAAGTTDDAQSPQLGPTLTVVATNPEPAVHLTEPPGAITLTFDRPIDPTSLGIDVMLDRVGDDETLTSLFDTGLTPTEAVDDSATQLIVTFDQTLAPGHYRIFLSANSSLMGQDYSMLGGDGTDQSLGDFWIDPQRISLSDATDLGTLGSTPISTSANLDLQTNPSDIELYKFSLDDSHFWRVGLEVDAQRDGSPLDAALALFDDHGHPLATNDLGRRDFPADPYLFAGLAAGTYYIGISATGNLPGNPGGYDLITGSVGSVAQSQDGGGFTLSAVADRADRPITLQSFTVDHGDPLNPSPTGLTLGFSSALAVPTEIGLKSSKLSQGIEVIDQAGHLRPVLASGYDEANARISYLFNDDLTPGQYTVRLPVTGGLVDLAGLSPVAPGQPAGTLGTFSVGAATGSGDPDDLGALLPSAALQGVDRYAALDAGASATFRFVVTVPGLYTLQVTPSAEPLAVSLADSKKLTVLDLQSLMQVNGALINLKPDVYLLHLTASSSQPVLVHWSLRLPDFSPDALLENGVGQGPALSLRLIAPIVLAPPPVQPAAPPSVPPIEIPIVASVPSTPQSAATNASSSAPSTAFSSSVPSLLLVTLGDLVGRPNPSNDRVSAVGPGGLALAANFSADLGPEAFALSPVPFQGPQASLARIKFRHIDQKSDGNPSAPTNGALLDNTAIPDAPPVEQAATAPGWLERLRAVIAKQFETTAPIDQELADAEWEEPVLASDLPNDMGENHEHAEQASLRASPFYGGLAAMVFIEYRRQMRRWLDRKRARLVAKRSAANSVLANHAPRSPEGGRVKPGVLTPGAPRRELSAAPRGAAE